MPSYTDVLKKRKKSVAVVYQKYLLEKKGVEKVYAFYEGKEDPSFYTSFIERVVGVENGLVSIRCEGKKYVHGIYEFLEKKGELANCHLFFTDKDLDDYIYDEPKRCDGVFETDYYSFENYLCTESMLNKILVEFYGLEDPKVRTRICEKYSVELEKFIIFIRPIIALAIEYRVAGFRFVFNNVNIGKFLFFDNSLSLLRKRGRDKQVASALKDEVNEGKVASISLSSSLKIVKELANCQHKCYVRGKFEQWFMVEFCRKLPAFLKAVKAKFRNSVDLHVGNFSRTLAPRVVSYPALEAYITNRVGN